MSKTAAVQIIIDASGAPVAAVLAWTEYQRLKNGMDEDAHLIALATPHMGEESFPVHVARRIASGENALKVIREWRGLSQGNLGAAAGVNPQYISQIERGDRAVGAKTAAKLAPVLGVSVDALTI
jgi:DNA-binding XRE family transcriptional regulator